jgi:restriction system protein
MSEPGLSTRRQGELLRAVFTILMSNPDGLPGGEVLDRMNDAVPPTEYELGHYPSNPNENRGRVATRFWTSTCKKAGWMEKTGAVWRVTDEGRRAFADFADPADFAREANRRYAAWRRRRKAEQGPAEGPSEAPEARLTVEPDDTAEITSVNVESAQEAAWAEIAAYLSTMDAYEFQDLVAALLRAMGYHVAWVSPPGPDRGLDILAYTDPLGATGPRIKVQVKRRADKTSVEGIRSFLAILGPHDVGLYICAGGFTSEAEREARSQETRRLTLVDLHGLFDLWVQHYESIDDADKALLPLRPVWFLAPEV